MNTSTNTAKMYENNLAREFRGFIIRWRYFVSK